MMHGRLSAARRNDSDTDRGSHLAMTMDKMRLKLFERRYWDVGFGKVFSVFSKNEDSNTLNCIPMSNNFFIWVDSKPFSVEFDVVLATSVADEMRNAAESASTAICSDPNNS